MGEKVGPSVYRWSMDNIYQRLSLKEEHSDRTLKRSKITRFNERISSEDLYSEETRYFHENHFDVTRKLQRQKDDTSVTQPTTQETTLTNVSTHTTTASNSTAGKSFDSTAVKEESIEERRERWKMAQRKRRMKRHEREDKEQQLSDQLNTSNYQSED